MLGLVVFSVIIVYQVLNYLLRLPSISNLESRYILWIRSGGGEEFGYQGMSRLRGMFD